MSEINEKVILTDADGVLLDWQYGFNSWMSSRGYEIVVPDVYPIDVRYDIPKAFGKDLVRHFNESANVGHMTPFRDAIKYVKKLHEEHGYVFHVITSQTNNWMAQKLRIKNLQEIFGKSVFDEYTILGTGDDKGDILSEYIDTDCYWIEDKFENFEQGVQFGLKGILMGHNYNLKDYGSSPYGYDHPRVNNWKQIYEYVTGTVSC